MEARDDYWIIGDGPTGPDIQAHAASPPVLMLADGKVDPNCFHAFYDHLHDVLRQDTAKTHAASL